MTAPLLAVLVSFTCAVAATPGVLEEPRRTGAVTALQQASASWCAPPRTPEPLLAEAREHASGHSLNAQVFRTTNKLPVLDAKKVHIVRDESVCRRAAEAYRPSHLRSGNAKWQLTPVLVVRVGPLYMVDDQRSRRGRAAFWAVLVFDAEFREAAGHFGSGY